MAKILVAGGLNEDGQSNQLNGALNQFVCSLGKEIISHGHILLGGCRTTLDAKVATSAHEEAIKRGLDPKSVVKSWVTANTEPSHDKGEIVRSRVSDWSHVPRRYSYPEPIQQADAVIIVGGWDGTHYAASWARLAQKPLIPVAAFGFAASEIFDDELSNFGTRYGAQFSVDEYQILNRLVGNWSADAVEAFAKDVLSLVERLILSTEVFVIMSFAQKGHLKDAYNTFCRVCKDYNFHAFKVDDHFDANQRIIVSIIEAIQRCAFIIADVSDPRPNVYYELGYAQALGKKVITTAYEGTVLPFDIFDIPTQYWDCQDTLESKLRKELTRIGQGYGQRKLVP
jgi:hypothetical protein